MILVAGKRTDIVTFYTPWLLNRVKEGFALVRNPFNPRSVSRYRIDRSVVDCLVLCSKNYRPLLPHLGFLDAQIPLLAGVTITAYGKDMEPRVPARDEMVAQVRQLAGILGRERVTWRYDPVVVTPKYSVEYHKQAFSWLCKKLAPFAGVCVFNFLHHFPGMWTSGLRHVTLDEQDELAGHFAREAQKYGIFLQMCAAGRDFSHPGISGRGCLSQELIEESLGVTFRKLPVKPQRKDCKCVETRALGAYDSCANGCVYCYATRHPALVARNMRLHDPTSPMLIGHPQPGDEVRDAHQKSDLQSTLQSALLKRNLLNRELLKHERATKAAPGLPPA